MANNAYAAPQNVNRHSNHHPQHQQRHSNHAQPHQSIPPPPPNNASSQQMQYMHGQQGGVDNAAHVQYVNYLNQQRQEHQRRQILAAQNQLINGGHPQNNVPVPNGINAQQAQPNSQHHSNQHHSMHQMAQTHKKLKKQQQGAYGYMPGAKGGDKSRKGSKNVMAVSKNNYGQHDDMNGKMKGISNKLEDYYSTSSDSEHDYESTDDSSTIASTDSYDEQHGHLESSSDESSIVSDILKEGANIPALNDMEGPINNLNIDVSNKKKKKKKRKKDKKSLRKSKKKKKKKKKKQRENSVSKSKSKRKKKVKKKKKKNQSLRIRGIMKINLISIHCL